jgi:ABC-type glycerol-3-phosphate transport system substrate-binding protein
MLPNNTPFQQIYIKQTDHRLLNKETKMNEKKLSRRDFIRLSALSGAGAVLAACAQTTEAPKEEIIEEPEVAPPPAEKVKITVWGWWQDRMNFFQESGNKFTADNPNIEVEVISIDQDMWTKVFASVPASTGPTLCKMLTTNYFKMRDQNLLLELDELTFDKGFLKSTFPNHPWDAYGYYVIPEGNQGALMIFNKAMFEEAGLDPDNPPTSWGEYVEAAKKLTKTDSSGAITVEGYCDDGWIINLNYLYQQGAMVVNRDGNSLKANFNTPEMKKTYEFLFDAAFTHKIWDYAFPYVSEAVGSALAATAIGEAWLVGEIKSNFPEVGEQLGFAALPTPTGEASPYYGRQNSVLGLSSLINRPENEIEAGRKFLEYLYKKDVDSQFKISNISGLVPAHVENLKRDDVVNDPFYNLMVKLVSKEYDTVEVTDAFADIFYAATDKLIVAQEPIDSILEYGQSELQKLIDSGELKYIQ